MKYPDLIAIDGPAGVGKSTIGEMVARELGYLYFDTGIMYRAATFAALRALGEVSDEKAVSDIAGKIQIDVRAPSLVDKRKNDVLVDGEDVTWLIREQYVERNVSQVSAYEGVRDAMTSAQRVIGKRGRVVMVGRDIGTVVFPNAKVKIFLTASAEERARRRYAEKLQLGEIVDYETILAEIKARDEIDTNREIAPLRPAKDAVIIDTDNLSIEEVFNKAMEIIRQRAKKN